MTFPVEDPFAKPPGFDEAQAKHEAHFGRLVRLSHLQAAAGRVERELERLRDESRELGLEEAADWFDSGRCAAKGGAKELADNGPGREE